MLCLYSLGAIAGCETEALDPEATPVRCETPEVEVGAQVVVENGKFVVDGNPLLPQGVNSYPLLQHIGEGNVEAVLDIFAQARELGRPFVRTNAFMDGGSHPARIREDDGTIRDEGLGALDQLLLLAEQSGIKLLLVLTNNWDDYGGAQAVVDAVAPLENLPKDAFWSEPRAVAAQREYVQTIVRRQNGMTGRSYGRDPTVFCWELANEPRCVDPDWCDGSQTLVRWASTMADALREAGAVQPIAWGGVGYTGRHGEDLAAIARDGGVDVLTLHLYPQVTYSLLNQLSTPERIDLAIEIGAQILAEGAEIAVRENLALIVEEFGWRSPVMAYADWERGVIYNGWLEAAMALDLAVLPWMIGERGRSDYDGFLIRPEHEQTVESIRCLPRSL